MRNPHFDDDLLVWDDDYSGRYQPPADGYGDQFDLQWQLCLDGKESFVRAPGAAVDDAAIADRIFEWTGEHANNGASSAKTTGTRPLDFRLGVNLIAHKDCIDIGCGLGRWTRVMQKLGARSVLSVDLSKSALDGVRRFNQNVLWADVTNLPAEHPELVNRFDFANLWGVAMHTHDPLKVFLSASATLKPGGALYLMVYAPEGMHNRSITNRQRKEFFRLANLQEKLVYADRVYDRRWDASSPLMENLKNVLRNLVRRPKGSKLGVLDMLEPFYNWVIPFAVIEGWARKGGFSTMRLLNQFEPRKCAHHVLMLKSE